MREYDIQKRGGECVSSGRQFEEGEEYYAVLIETPEGFERRDYSAEAWEVPPDGYFCYWKSRVPRRVERSQHGLVDNGVIINLFLRLEEATEDIKLQFRFVIALILMRKRILKYEETVQREECEYWIMRMVREQTRYEVLNPRLDEEQMARVSEELGAILRGDPRSFQAVDALAEGGSADGAQDTPEPPVQASPETENQGTQ